MCIFIYMEMARVTGVSIASLLTRGQQIKVVSQLLRKVDSSYKYTCIVIIMNYKIVLRVRNFRYDKKII